MKIIQLKNNARPLPAPLQAIYCSSFLCRLRGLMFRSHQDRDKGLLLVQSRDSRVDSSIHMLFVYMDLGVIWINNEMTVVDTVRARAWKLAYAPRAAARYVLEIHPDRLDEFQIGDKIEFQNA